MATCFYIGIDGSKSALDELSQTAELLFYKLRCEYDSGLRGAIAKKAPNYSLIVAYIHPLFAEVIDGQFFIWMKRK